MAATDQERFRRLLVETTGPDTAKTMAATAAP
jgi:hypothetical protein